MRSLAHVLLIGGAGGAVLAADSERVPLRREVLREAADLQDL